MMISVSPNKPFSLLFCILLILMVFTPQKSFSARHELEENVSARKDGISWSVGIFSPLRICISEKAELELHPLIALAAPHINVRIMHGQSGKIRFAGEYSLLIPTPAMRLTKGFLFPEWDMSDNNIGWFLVPGTALNVSYGDEAITRFSMAFAAAIPLTENNAIPLDSYAPLDLLLAPMLKGHRFRIGVFQEYPITEKFQFRGGLDLWISGQGPERDRSPYYFSGNAGMKYIRNSGSYFMIGAAWYNSDQRRYVLKEDEKGFAVRKAIRSNDFFPLFDYVISF